METKTKIIHMYELPNNNLIITVIKMFNNLKRLQIKKKKNCSQESSPWTKWEYQQKEIQKEPNRNSGVEKNKKFTERFQ